MPKKKAKADGLSSVQLRWFTICDLFSDKSKKYSNFAAYFVFHYMQDK